MTKFHNELFYIPKHAKISDKAMLIRAAVTVVIMVVCLAAMSITAYAYFSCSVTSGSNIIKSANFDATISAVDENNVPLEVTADGNIRKITLEPGTYTVTVSKTDSSTAQTGFCIVTIGSTEYHTQQLGSVSFTITVATETEVSFLCHWGTSSCYGYDNLDSNPNYITSDKSIDLSDG